MTTEENKNRSIELLIDLRKFGTIIYLMVLKYLKEYFQILANDQCY